LPPDLFIAYFASYFVVCDHTLNITLTDLYNVTRVMCVQQISSATKCPVNTVAVKKAREYRGSLVGLIVILLVIALMLLVAFIIWIVFAVQNPNSSAGQCLIQVLRLLTCILVYRADFSVY